MVNRKTKRVTLEIYEEQETEFRGLIWMLKNILNDPFMGITRGHYEDPSIFDNYVKEYWDFLKEFVGMIYIDSVDGNNPIPLLDIAPVHVRNIRYQSSKTEIDFKKSDKEELKPEFDEEISDEERLKLKRMVEANSFPQKELTKEELELTREISGFVERSNVIGKVLSPERKDDLIDFIFHQIKVRRIGIYRRDKFWEAAKKYTRGLTTIDTELKALMSIPFFFGYDPNLVFQETSEYNPRKMNVRERYRLTGDLFQHTEFYFSELSESRIGKDYQLRTIIGFILAKISMYQKKKVLLDEGEYLNEMRGTKPWRDYLADYVLAWLRKANELGIEKYPTGRQPDDFYGALH